jgi:hypothetical protein
MRYGTPPCKELVRLAGLFPDESAMTAFYGLALSGVLNFPNIALLQTPDEEHVQGVLRVFSRVTGLDTVKTASKAEVGNCLHRLREMHRLASMRPGELGLMTTRIVRVIHEQLPDSEMMMWREWSRDQPDAYLYTPLGTFKRFIDMRCQWYIAPMLYGPQVVNPQREMPFTVPHRLFKEKMQQLRLTLALLTFLRALLVMLKKLRNFSRHLKTLKFTKVQ